MKIYITHCTYKKDNNLKGTNIEVTPDKLYIGKRIQSFMKRCKDLVLNWAIFSDLYGIWFSNEKHKWYEKSPNDIIEEEFKELLDNTESRLKNYDEIYFYANYRSPRFHSLYKRLINELKNRNLNIIMISKLKDIE